MEYITMFINNLFSSIAGFFSFGGSASTLHSTTTVGGTYTTVDGTETVSDADDLISSTTGTAVVSLGTSVIQASSDAYNNYQAKVITVQTSKAYIESLPEKDLDEIIASLSNPQEEKQNNDSNVVKEPVKKLSKKL